MRIRKGQFFADIVADPHTPGVYHCLVQQEGSSEILHWSQERTEKEAIQAAKLKLARLTFVAAG
jgi:hypothetical protein